MCGIVGFISDNQNEQLIKSLVSDLEHRGPDESGYEIIKIDNGYLHLGSSRLSITGIIDGTMPMKNNSGDCLVYNGELYQIDQLKSKFNYRENTKSDTKILFDILKRNGTSAISELNGMFAFSFYNSEKNELVVGRDKLGIKPVYFTQNEKFPFVFSSEIRPLLLNNMLNSTIQRSTIESYFLFNGFTTDAQIINNLESVNPGEIVSFKKNKIIKEKYFSIDDYTNLNIEENQNFSDILKEVVNDQLVAEVPVNILLSGGIDSSLIASVINSKERNVNAFNLSYKNKRYDESMKAQIIANQLDINLEIFEFDIKNNEHVINEIFEKLPEPISDPSIVPTYFLSKKVSKYTKAVLSGDGADELFSGYEWYRGFFISQYIPKFFQPGLNKLSKSTLLNNINYLPLSDRIQLFTEYSEIPYEERLLFWQSFVSRNDLLIDQQREIFQNYLTGLKARNTDDVFENIRLIDLQTYLYTNILKKGDISSMLNGLEIRPIFLDDRIIKYALSNKASKNVGLFSTKTELRKLLGQFNKDVSKMKKHGFAHDFGSWTDTVGIPYLKKEFAGEKTFDLNFKTIENNNISKYKKERTVWKIYSIFRWLKENGVTIVD